MGVAWACVTDQPTPSRVALVLPFACGRPDHGDLERWAAQGVLLLNTVLTVRAHQARTPLLRTPSLDRPPVRPLDDPPALLHHRCAYRWKPCGTNRARWAGQGIEWAARSLFDFAFRSLQANSHQKRGWEVFTDGVIRTVSRESSGVVFMLWGKQAQDKARLVSQTTKHLVLQCPHPSVRSSAPRGAEGAPRPPCTCSHPCPCCLALVQC